MVIGIVGLGLIGGSLAKAYKREDNTVLGYDIDQNINEFATISGAADGVLNRDNISKCELILLAAYPHATISYLKEMSPYISSNTFVIDCLGTKRKICEVGFQLAKEYGYTFVGGHPMAGTHNSGFKYSRANLFNGAPMVIVPPAYDDMALLEKIKELLLPVGFGEISVTTAEEHDEIIAFTSQLAHIVSNAYIKSPTAKAHKGFSAGSYKDMTRVAWMNPNMWTELFLENKDNLEKEIDFIIGSLSEYKKAIHEDDNTKLCKLLEDGCIRKAEVDGR